jgi:hypothetical protein
LKIGWISVVDDLPEDGVTGATDALSATSEEAVTSVEADGALGGDEAGREGNEEDGELHVGGSVLVVVFFEVKS